MAIEVDNLPSDMDFGAEDAAANGHVEEAVPGVAEETEPAIEAKGLYLVRIPKPPMDDSELKKHQADFQSHVQKLKDINAKLSVKRGEVRALRQQMSEARGLKETSEPEFQDKLGRMKQLRDLRNNYIARITDIKSNLQGLECKSEQELEEKIRSLEASINHGSLSLREEKMVISQISKLNSQRGKVKEYDTHKDTLKELQTEVDKIKAIIGEMESEFNVIKDERTATNTVVQDIYKKLTAARKDLEELETEQKELVAAKEEALRALDDTRGETNNSMRDYRENRKFSLTIRDLVAAGQVEEARALVNAQADEWIPRLCSDAAYRKEYQQLWAEQRRFPVSELLPQSCTAAAQAAAGAGSRQVGGRGGRGGRGGAAGGGAAARPPPPEPRGAEKAKSIIEQLMLEASREAAANKARNPDDDDDELDHSTAAEGTTPAPAAAAAAPAAKKAEAYKAPSAAASSLGSGAAGGRLVQDPAAAAAAAFNFKVDMPKVAEMEEFVPPVLRDSNADAQLDKQALREEQARKAAEAEERKRRRAEQAERKRLQAIEAAKRLEAERKERDAAARAAAAQGKSAATQPASAAAAQPAAEATGVSDGGAAAAGSAAAVSNTGSSITKAAAPTPWEKRQQMAAAKRPKNKSVAVIKPVNTIWQKYQGWIVFGVVMFLVLILVLMSARS